MKKLLPTTYILGLFVLLVSCQNLNLFSTTNTNTTSFKDEIKGKLLKFEPKAKWQNLDLTSESSSGFKINDVKVNQEISFSSVINAKDVIKIPEKGKYKIIIEKGSSFAIKDDSAIDGQCVITIPEGNYEGFLSIGEGKGTLIDNLYHVKQELNKTEVNKWYMIGKRKFPIPENWGNPEKESYVIEIDSENIKEMKMKWYETKLVDYPLGMKEIGSEGGVIDIQGVGHLSIPAGAIEKPTLVKVSQELEAEEVVDLVHKEYGKIEDFASPIIKIEPLGLELKKPATIYLDTDKERLGNNSPLVISWMFSKDKKFWQDIGYIDNDMEVSQYKENTPSIITTFGFLSKQISSEINPNDGLLSYKESLKSSFNINSTSPCNNKYTDDEPHDSHFYASTPLDYDCVVNTGFNFIIHYNSDNNQSIPRIVDRIKFSYQEYHKYTNISFNSPVHIIVREFNKTGFSDEEKKLFDIGPCYTKTTLKVRIEPEKCIEHEIWHLFQYKKLVLSLTGLTYLNEFKYGYGKAWIWESSAEYIGARTFKKYSDQKNKTNNLNLDMKKNYQDNLELSLKNINKTFPYYETDSKGYLGVGFFTTYFYNKKDEQIYKLALNDIFDMKDFDKYFNYYVISTYLQETFNIYNPNPYDNSYKYKDLKRISPKYFNIISDSNFNSNEAIISSYEVTRENKINNKLYLSNINTLPISANFIRIVTDYIPNNKQSIRDLVLETNSIDKNLEIKLLVYKNHDLKGEYNEYPFCKNSVGLGNVKNNKNYFNDYYNPYCYRGSNANDSNIKKYGNNNNDIVVKDFRKGDYLVLIISNPYNSSSSNNFSFYFSEGSNYKYL